MRHQTLLQGIGQTRSPAGLLESIVTRADELAEEIKKASGTSQDPIRQARNLSSLLLRCADLVMDIHEAEQAHRLRQGLTRTPIYLALDVAQLRMLGLLMPDAPSSILFRPGSHDLTGLSVQANGEGIELVLRGALSQTILITSTNPSFGGERSWFICPGIDGRRCARRALRLYQSREASAFACRNCHRRTHDRGWKVVGQRRIVRPTIQWSD